MKKFMKYMLASVAVVVVGFVVFHTRFDFDMEGARTSLDTGVTYVGQGASVVGDAVGSGATVVGDTVGGWVSGDETETEIPVELVPVEE